MAGNRGRGGGELDRPVWSVDKDCGAIGDAGGLSNPVASGLQAHALCPDHLGF